MVDEQSGSMERFGTFDQTSLEAFIGFLPDLEDLEASLAKAERYSNFERLYMDLYRMIYDKGWVVVFDWSSWAHGEEGQRIFRTDDGIEHANLDQLCKAITALARADRFQQNLFSNCVHDGTFLRIARRVEQLHRESNQAT